MKKKLIWTVVLLFVGSAAVAGAWEASRLAGIVFALALLAALAAVWGLFRKKGVPAEPDPEEAERSAPSDPDTVNYPFVNLGMGRALEPRDFIVLDTETTGFSPRDDKIIEVAALKIRDGEGTWFHSLVDPGRRIPLSSRKVHGITDADVAAAPSFAQILPELDAFLDPSLPIVGQNVHYDLRMLWWAYHDAGVEMGARSFIDTYKLAKKAFPGRDSYSLASLIRDYQLIEGEQRHRSESDVEAALALYRLCREKLGEPDGR